MDPRAGLPEAYWPRTKLFLSADIIGSTAYKQPFNIKRKPEQHGRWSVVVSNFYSNTEKFLKDHWSNSLISLEENQAEKLLGSPPRFWKSVGDEVLFWKEVEHASQVWLTLACWMRTVESLRGWFDDLAKREDTSPLDVKCTAWVAEFPARNRAVFAVKDDVSSAEEVHDQLLSFYNERADAPNVDFIGPGIDVGFRLSRFSSSKKMSISVDVAHLLATTVEDEDVEGLQSGLFLPAHLGSTSGTFTDRFKVCYSGSEELKGVLGGILYPKLWISTIRHGSLDSANELIRFGECRQNVSWDHLRRFCKSFYEDRNMYICEPFVINDVLRKPDKEDFIERYMQYVRDAVPGQTL